MLRSVVTRMCRSQELGRSLGLTPKRPTLADWNGVPIQYEYASWIRMVGGQVSTRCFSVEQPTKQSQGVEEKTQQAKVKSNRAKAKQRRKKTKASASVDSVEGGSPEEKAAANSDGNKVENVKESADSRQRENASTTSVVLEQVDLEETALQGKSDIDLASKSIEMLKSRLEEIQRLQSELPSIQDMNMIIESCPSDVKDDALAAFDLYRKCGSAKIEARLLIPSVRVCCEIGDTSRAIELARDMIAEARVIDHEVFECIFQSCERNNAADDALALLYLMRDAGVSLQLYHFKRTLAICDTASNVQAAYETMKMQREITGKVLPMKTYMYWLGISTEQWCADAFFNLLLEIRLAGLEPEIPSLTSLQPGREDLALTVMEGVRAVGLDPHFALTSVFESMKRKVHQRKSGVSRMDKQKLFVEFGSLKRVEINWPTRPIPQLLETQAAGLILNQEGYARLKVSQVEKIEQYLSMLPIDSNLTLNLRKQLQRMSLMANSRRIKKNKHSILQEYESGEKLLCLSKKHNYPPVSIMRVVLEARGMSATDVKNSISAPEEFLNNRDRQQLSRASREDSMFRSDPLLPTDGLVTTPSEFEDMIHDFFVANGVRVKSESELMKEQQEKYGRKVLSPDLLLLDPVVINGVPIRWIDAKNYYGAHLVDKRLISRQLKNYVDEWGPGAVVFRMGFSSMLDIPGVMCLDSTPLPKSKWDLRTLNMKSNVQKLKQFFNWSPKLSSDLKENYLTAEEMHEQKHPMPSNMGEMSDGDEFTVDKTENK